MSRLDAFSLVVERLHTTPVQLVPEAFHSFVFLRTVRRQLRRPIGGRVARREGTRPVRAHGQLRAAAGLASREAAARAVGSVTPGAEHTPLSKLPALRFQRRPLRSERLDAVQEARPCLHIAGGEWQAAEGPRNPAHKLRQLCIEPSPGVSNSGVAVGRAAGRQEGKSLRGAWAHLVFCTAVCVLRLRELLSQVGQCSLCSLLRSVGRPQLLRQCSFAGNGILEVGFAFVALGGRACPSRV